MGACLILAAALEGRRRLPPIFVQRCTPLSDGRRSCTITLMATNAARRKRLFIYVGSPDGCERLWRRQSAVTRLSKTLDL